MYFKGGCCSYGCDYELGIVQSTISMHSMLMLGDLGACPLRKCLKIDALRLNFGVFWTLSYVAAYINSDP